jgi:hypothetical protein
MRHVCMLALACACMAPWVLIRQTMMLCFFSLLASMMANINEQNKEIGVLLAIGLECVPTCTVSLFAALCSRVCLQSPFTCT